MRKPRVTIGDLVPRTDAGRRVVCSVGSLDGPMLAALQRLQVAVVDGEQSTWAEGIGPSNRISDMPGGGASDR